MWGPTIGTNVSSPADKDRIIECAKLIRLTEMQATEAPTRRRSPFYGVGRTFTRIQLNNLCRSNVKGMSF